MRRADPLFVPAPISESWPLATWSLLTHPSPSDIMGVQGQPMFTITCVTCNSIIEVSRKRHTVVHEARSFGSGD